MEVTTPAIDLASLPPDLLLEILKDCDDKLLYHLAWTCRALHMAALTILFRRYAKDINEGTLSLVSCPDFMLPALHGAIFVRDLNSIYVHMRDDIGILYRDLRIIKDLTARTTSLRYFTLNFTTVGSHRKFVPQYTTLDDLCKTLQDLMDLAVDKGCEWLYIVSDNTLKGILPPPAPPLKSTLITKERPKRSKFFSQLWGKVGGALSNRDSKESPYAWTPVEPNSATSKPMVALETSLSQWSIQPSYTLVPTETQAATPTSPNPTSDTAPDSVSQETTPCRYADTKLYYVTLYSRLFFEEPMWDWTFNVLSGPRINSLRIDQDSFVLETWVKALPLIHISNLRTLHYTAVKQEIPTREFTDFLARHAPKILNLTLVVHPFPPKQPDDPETAIDFQSLGHLQSNASTINWVLWAAKAAHSDDHLKPCLSGLSHVSFQEPQAVRSYIPVTQTDWLALDKALSTLSDIASQQVSPRKEMWLTSLDIECGDNFTEWAEGHISDPSASPFASFRNIIHFSLSVSRRHFDDSEMRLLPRLWAFFPGLLRVSIRNVWLDRLKARGGKYWKGVQKDCPKLTMVCCNWTVDLKVKDLLNDDWPDFGELSKVNRGPGLMCMYVQ
ncbi:hypothetical protein BDN72DRAFT_583503 [Pluteus cervinus]|uniref:Uncharacterized protein n=1 Tax=Pluteus cervinus TaxID=181527 RepID=A0ACD3AWX9_9AGAR|nr:hypothetical protein BDN72DRAFT_583503 [Pluteus cervinus]